MRMMPKPPTIPGLLALLRSATSKTKTITRTALPRPKNHSKYEYDDRALDTHHPCDIWTFGKFGLCGQQTLGVGAQQAQEAGSHSFKGAFHS